jgi:hypothetical protein
MKTYAGVNMYCTSKMRLKTHSTENGSKDPIYGCFVVHRLPTSTPVINMFSGYLPRSTLIINWILIFAHTTHTMSKTNGSVAMTFQAAIAGLQWPLDDAHDAPLYFKPLEEMVEIRRKEKRAADAAGAAIAANVRTSIASLLAPVANANDPNLSEQDQEHYARIAVALLLLGHGYTDEAHNLVSPLSWTKETVFGYGPPHHYIYQRHGCEFLCSFTGTSSGSPSRLGVQHDRLWQC